MKSNRRRTAQPARNFSPKTVAGYSGTPLWKKLGYKDGDTAYVEGSPAAYPAMLGLPSEISVRWVKCANAGIKFVHLFGSSKTKLAEQLQALRKTIHPGAVIWVSWPKKASGVQTDITEDVIRDIALPIGLVDIKVCAVDAVWSGLKLMIRKELR